MKKKTCGKWRAEDSGIGSPAACDAMLGHMNRISDMLAAPSQRRHSEVIWLNYKTRRLFTL